MELILGVFAAFAVWMSLRAMLPFRIPERLAPFAIAGVAYGVLSIPEPKIVLALACVTGVSLLTVLLLKLGTSLPAPWSGRAVSAYLPRVPRRRTTTGVGHVPGEAPGPGRRIPRL